MSIFVRLQPLGGARLVRDYLEGRPEATRFYGHPSPFALDAFRRQLLVQDARFDRAARARAAAALTPSLASGAERLRRFVEEGGAVVTTGQQAGLFTGPVLTIYKALTAVRLAAELEAALGVVVLPVFWCASEDHDWAEIDHADVLGSDGSVVRVGVSGAADPPLPIADRTLPDDVEFASAQIRKYLLAKGDGPPHLEAFEAAYRPGAGVAEAFRQALGAMMADAGIELFLTDAADDAVKAGSTAVLLREARMAAETEARLHERGLELEAAGYHQQVAVMPGGANLFLHTEAGREKLYRDARVGWRAGQGRVVAAAALEATIEVAPARVSPNALLRPVVESAVFPVLAYVAGPAEAAYFAQAQVLFEAHGVPMPVVYPRQSLLLEPERVARERESLGLEPADLARPLHEVQQRLLRRAMPAEAAAALAAVREAIVERYEPLIEAAAALDPTLRLAIARERNAALLGAARAERRLIGGVRRRSAERLARLDRVRSALRPGGAAQERVLNVLSFLGDEPALLQRLLGELRLRLDG